MYSSREGALQEDSVKERYFARKKAINFYLDGATALQIKNEAGIGLSQTIRLIKERCLSVHKDGEVWGWRALVPWLRINPYHRKRRIDLDRSGKGGAGALQAVLRAHPHLRERFDKRILSAGSQTRLSIIKRNKLSHWKWFLDELRLLNYETERLSTRAMYDAGLVVYSTDAQASPQGYLYAYPQVWPCYEWADSSPLTAMLNAAAEQEIESALIEMTCWLDAIDDRTPPAGWDGLEECVRLRDEGDGISLIRWVHPG